MALIQRVKLESSAARREWKQLQEEPKKYSRETRSAVTGASDDVRRSAGKMSGMVKTAFAGMIAFIGTQVLASLGRVSGRLFEIGTAVEETAAKFRTTFGPAADQVDEFLETTGRMAGLTQQRGREITATLGAMAQGFDLSQQASADFSQEVVTLAADMASFNNTSIDESLQAIQSGLIGEQEPLRRYGILLSAATVEQKALQMRAAGVTGELTEQEKVLARLALAYEMAGVAVGDLERTQDSTANTARRLRAEAGQIVEEFSVGLIPAYGELISRGKELLQLFKSEADTLGGAFSNAIVNATEFVVDMGIASGRTASSVLAMLDALGFFSEQEGIGDAILGQLGQIAENFANLHVLGRGFVIVLHEARAAIFDLREAMAGLTGDSEGAIRMDILGEQARRDAEAQRDILREQRAADNRRRRGREERRRQIAAEIEAARALRETLGEGGMGSPSAESLQKAEETLSKISEALSLTRQASDEERKHLAAMRADRERILELQKVEGEVNREKWEFAMQAATEELEASTAALEKSTKLREAFKAAADSFEGLVPKGGRDPRIAKLMEIGPVIRELRVDKDGIITSEALQQVGMTADEAERLAEKLKKSKEEGDDLSDVLDSVATSIRAVTRFVDVFGDLSDEARLAADGIADIVDNIGQLAEAEGSLFSAENFPALVGAAAGVGSIIASIVSASEANREEMKRLRDALRASTRAYQEAIRSQFEGGRVGRGISEEQLERARAIVEEIRSLSSAERDRRQELLRELSELGIEPLEGAFDMASDLFGSISEAGVIEFGLDAGRIQKGDIRKLVDAILLGGDVPEAIADLLGTSDLSEILEGLNIHLPRGFQNFLEFLSQAEGGLGEFTNDVAGAAERVRFMEQFLGTEAPAAARAFIQSLLDVEGITPQFKSALEDLLAIDVSTEEGRAQFDEQIQALADRFAEGGEAMDGWLGSLDPAEFQQILELLFGYAEEFGQKLEEAGDEMADGVKSAAEKMQEASQNIRDAITFADRLGLSSNAIADIIVDNFQKLFEGEIPKVARNLLGNIRGLDLSSQQGQETLSKIIKQLMEAVLSATTLTEFGLTEEQARKMLDALEGIEQSAGDTPESRFTSSVTNLRQLSFAQGSELVFLTIEANLTRMRILEQVRAASGILSGLLVAIRSRPPIGFEFPPNLSAAMSNITAPRTPSSTASEWAVHPNMSATFGDININGVVIPMDDFARFVGTQIERYIQDNT